MTNASTQKPNTQANASNTQKGQTGSNTTSSTPAKKMDSNHKDSKSGSSQPDKDRARA
jgi:hypothetical protein